MSGPYLGFFVCGGKLGFREISDQYSYKKQPSKIRHYVRKKTFSFPGGGNCPLRPPAMYGPECKIFCQILQGVCPKCAFPPISNSGQRSLRHIDAYVYCVENMEKFHSFVISRIQEKIVCKI